MKFKGFGSKENPPFIILHGGGLSWWSLQGLIDELEKDYEKVSQ